MKVGIHEINVIEIQRESKDVYRYVINSAFRETFI